MNLSNRKLLIVRPDRLGDVILSTPVIQTLNKKFPSLKIDLWVRPQFWPLLDKLPGINRCFYFENNFSELGRASHFLKEQKYDVVLFLLPQFLAAASASVAGVPLRVGPYGKWFSYLLFNRGIRQHRSQSDRHEADYSLDLLKCLDFEKIERVEETKLALNLDAQSRARDWLLKQGWDEESPICAVHPGMGGSALNWPENIYAELIRRLTETNAWVLVTGGPAENELLERIRTRAPQAHFYFAQKEGVDFLAGLISHSKVVVAPSTGPLHLAVALGIRVVTFYPPIRVQSAIRWGPYTDAEKQFVMTPVEPLQCGQVFECRGKACRFFPCMDTLEPAVVTERVLKWLNA